MSEDREPLLKEHAVRQPATTAPSRPDIEIRLAGFELLAEPKSPARPDL